MKRQWVHNRFLFSFARFVEIMCRQRLVGDACVCVLLSILPRCVLCVQVTGGWSYPSACDIYSKARRGGYTLLVVHRSNPLQKPKHEVAPTSLFVGDLGMMDDMGDLYIVLIPAVHSVQRCCFVA